MDKFVRNLITEWRRLEVPFGGSAIVVGTSGGADSVSLLLALDDLKKRKKISHRIVAAHFNHKLRDGASDADEAFVRGLTSDRKIELAVGKSTGSTDKNLEQNARRARYDFLTETARRLNAFAVVTAHTMNDQAETVLMNLLRGSGPDGLAGMRSVRVLAEGRRSPEAQQPELPLTDAGIKLVRPLLTWAMREDTEAYCHKLGIEFRYDTMNEDTAYRRVRIRKILLPLLEDFNPRIVATLGNTARLMQNIADGTAENGDGSQAGELALDELRAAEGTDIQSKIRSWLKMHRGTTRRLELKHIQAIERLAFSTKSGRSAELPGGRVIKRNGSLVYEENKVENSRHAV